MVSQNVWVCISVVVFFAGLSIGYTVLQNTAIIMPQNMQTMHQWMQNHEFMTKMMSAIINDPQLRLQMLGHMTENQEVMQQMRELMQTGNITSGPMMEQYP